MDRWRALADQIAPSEMSHTLPARSRIHWAGLDGRMTAVQGGRIGMDVVAAPFPVSWDVDANVASMERRLAGSPRGSLVAFPEGALSGYSDDLAGLGALNPARLETALAHIQSLAVRHQVSVALGTLWPAQGGRAGWTNSAVVVSPDIPQRWWYHKVNLATHERGVLAFGNQLAVRAGAPAVLGVQLCRDLRFPEQWRWLCQQGAEVLLYLTHAVGEPRAYSVWKSHLVSRAAENQRFVVAVNTAHPEQMCPTAIIDPRGDILAETQGADAQVLTAALHLDAVSDWYLSQSRTDLLRIVAGAAHATSQPRPPHGNAHR